MLFASLRIQSYISAIFSDSECNDTMNMEYSLLANCERKCGHVAPVYEQERASDGCRCKEGFFSMSGQCVTEKDCGCRYRLRSNGVYDVVSIGGCL